jgi:hypothetical protein
LAKDRRPPADLWFVQLALEAQGYKCFCCGKVLTLTTCQRGHIDKRNLDGSNDGPENVAPICERCNKQHAKSEIAPHNHLAPDYFERLRILLLARIPGEISCKVMASSRKVILTTERDENTYFIDLKNSKFDPRTEVYNRSRKLTPNEAGKLADDLIGKAAQHGAPDPLDANRRTMISKALDFGADAFQRVGTRMLRKQMWRIDDRTDMIFWQRVFDNFERHERDERQYEREVELQRQREREQQERQREDQARQEDKKFALSKQSLMDETREYLGQAIAMIDQGGFGDLSAFVMQLEHLKAGINAATSQKELDDCETGLKEISGVLNQMAIAKF